MIQLLESFNNEGLLAQPLVVLSSKNESWVFCKLPHN